MRARHAVPLALVLAALAVLGVACGGGASAAKSQDVPANAIALVGSTPVLKADFDHFFAQAAAAYKAQGRAFPKVGTPEYERLKSQAVDLLVERVEFAKEAQLLGITVTDADVEKRLKELKDQFFKGDEAAYQAELKKEGVTDADVKINLRAQLVNEQIFAEVTKNATVTEQDVQKYYDQNKSRFTTPETRGVAHILLDTKAEADTIYRELQNGADFAKLAMEKSKDTQTGKNGGKLTARNDGSLVAPFAKVAFDLKTGEISQPVQTQFGWHVIKALTDIAPAKLTPLADVKSAIRDQLLQDKKNKMMDAWVSAARAKYTGQVAYAVGFEPPAGSTTSTVTTGAST